MHSKLNVSYLKLSFIKFNKFTTFVLRVLKHVDYIKP